MAPLRDTAKKRTGDQVPIVGTEGRKNVKADNVCLRVLIAYYVAAFCCAQWDVGAAQAPEVETPSRCLRPGAIPSPNKIAQLTGTNVVLVPLNGDIYARSNHVIRLGEKDVPVVLTREMAEDQNTEGKWVCHELRSRSDAVAYSRVFLTQGDGVRFRLFAHGTGSNFLTWVSSSLLCIEEVSSAKEKRDAYSELAAGTNSGRYVANVGRFLRTVGDIPFIRETCNMEISVASAELDKRGQLRVQFESATERKYTLTFDGRTCHVLTRNGYAMPLDVFPHSDWPGQVREERTLQNGVRAMPTGSFNGVHVLLSCDFVTGKWRAFTEDGKELPWRNFSEDDWTGR